MVGIETHPVASLFAIFLKTAGLKKFEVNLSDLDGLEMSIFQKIFIPGSLEVLGLYNFWIPLMQKKQSDTWIGRFSKVVR